MAGPYITIDGIVTVGGGDVFLGSGAERAGKDRVWEALQVAWRTLEDPDLQAAWHGAVGPMAAHHQLTFEEYLDLKRGQ
jgi:hypothetical protein